MTGIDSKLILAVVDRADVGRLVDALQEGGFGATSIGSVGGFLRRGNTTVLVAAPEDHVEAALAIVRRTCGVRELVPAMLGVDLVEVAMELPSAHVGGGVVFVLPVERVERV